MDKAEARRVYYNTNSRVLDLVLKEQREGLSSAEREEMARLRRKMNEARAIVWPEEER